jgi:hypothetical protein
MIAAGAISQQRQKKPMLGRFCASAYRRRFFRLFGETCLPFRLFGETCLPCRLFGETCLPCRLFGETQLTFSQHYGVELNVCFAEILPPGSHWLSPITQVKQGPYLIHASLTYAVW